MASMRTGTGVVNRQWDHRQWDRPQWDHRQWDVIVVGARVAGAATAMLLARAGLRVLCLDKSRRGSDTLFHPRVDARRCPAVAALGSAR